MKSLSRLLRPPFSNLTTTLPRNHSPNPSSLRYYFRSYHSSIPFNRSLLYRSTESTESKSSKSLGRRWFHVNSWSKPSKAVLGLNSVKRDFAIQNPRRLKSSKSGDRLARSPKNEVEENPKSGVLDVINQGKKNGKVMSSTELGTLYENQVIEVLKTFGFKLFRTGGSGDKGIDFRGEWFLSPSTSTGSPVILPVLGQCKCWHKPLSGSHIQALDGALSISSEKYGKETLGIMVSSEGFTKQAIKILNGISRPMMLLHVERPWNGGTSQLYSDGKEEMSGGYSEGKSKKTSRTKGQGRICWDELVERRMRQLKNGIGKLPEPKKEILEEVYLSEGNGGNGVNAPKVRGMVMNATTRSLIPGLKVMIRLDGGDGGSPVVSYQRTDG